MLVRFYCTTEDTESTERRAAAPRMLATRATGRPARSPRLGGCSWFVEQMGPEAASPDLRQRRLSAGTCVRMGTGSDLHS